MLLLLAMRFLDGHDSTIAVLYGQIMFHDLLTTFMTCSYDLDPTLKIAVRRGLYLKDHGSICFFVTIKPHPPAV